MKLSLVLTVLWTGLFVVAIPQPHNHPSPDCKTPSPTSRKTTSTSTKKTTSSTKKISTSTKKPSSTAKSTSTKKTSTSTKRTSTSTKKTPTTTTKKTSTSTKSTSKATISSAKTSATSVSSSTVITPSVSSSSSAVLLVTSTTAVPSVSTSELLPSVSPSVTPPDPGCGVRTGNIVKNGNFADLGTSWSPLSTNNGGNVRQSFSTTTGATADAGNTNSFNLKITAYYTNWVITIFQDVCLVAGTPYALSFLTGISLDGANYGTSYCSLQVDVDGLVVSPSAGVCGDPYLPDDYGTCTIPNTDPTTRYTTNSASFTAGGTSGGISSRLSFTFTCAGNLDNNNYPPSALLDDIILTGA